MLCSEWVPSEWESKQLIKTSQQSTSNDLKRQKLVNSAWSVQISLLIQTRPPFHWMKHYYGLWTLYFSNGLNLETPINTQLLLSQIINWWTGVDYYDVFIRLSFWRHPFTAEHPLLRHWCNAIWWRNNLIYFLQHIFSKSSFCVNYSFNSPPQTLEFDQMSVTSSLNNEHIQQNNRAGLWAAHASARGGSHQWTGTILSVNWIFVYAMLLLLRWIRFALLCVVCGTHNI